MKKMLCLIVPVLAVSSVLGASSAAAAPAACAHPADVLDLANWKETLPTGSPGKPTEVKQPKLATFSQDPWFTATPGCDGVRFRAAVTGVTTSGSKNPRSELRQMDGGAEASWSTTSGTHTMTVEETVTHLPRGKDHVVVAQIHDADDDVTVFRVEGSKIYVTNGDTTHYRLVTDSYALGTRFQVRFVAGNGRIQAYFDDKLVATLEKKSSGDYFKAGAYTQANCDTSDPCSDDNYGEVVIHRLTLGS